MKKIAPSSFFKMVSGIALAFVFMLATSFFGTLKFAATNAAAKSNNIVDAFKVVFEHDNNVSVGVFLNQDYTQNSSVSDIDYSRNSSGQLVSDGSGELNFEIKLKSGYVLDEIISTSGYETIMIPEELGRENTYRITGIIQNLIVRIFTMSADTPSYELNNFASVTDANGDITFDWDTSESYDSVAIEVQHNGISENFSSCSNCHNSCSSNNNLSG